MPYDLSGRRIVVTGAATGVGAALLDLLAESGATDVTVLDLKAPTGPHATYIATDLSDEAAVDAALAAIEGRVDVLFNNAGVADTLPPATVFQVNTLAPITLAQRLLPQFNDAGAIVTTASIAGLRWADNLALIQELLDLDGWEAMRTWFDGRELGVDPYSFTKQVMQVWTLRFSKPAAAKGVRVNSVCPAPIDTPLLADFRATMSDAAIDFSVEQGGGRLVTPREVAECLAWLASPAASFVNGVNLNVDGGLAAALTTGQVTFAARPAEPMGIRDIGPLLGADEGLNHQIVDTFATIAHSDYAWTEKIWVSIAKADGSIQANLGLGKYPNRGLIDGFGGVSRGREQWTVRGSRELRSAPEQTAIGPIVYEVVDPLGAVRVRLEPNDVQPISFDLVLRGVTPPFFEERNLVRNPQTNRVDVNVIRYHQGGWATGTITVDGERYELTGEDGFGFRDHSWGVRQGVGDDPTDLPSPPATARSHARRRGMMKWTPAFFRRPDGTYYESSVFLTGGGWNYASAYVNDADGRQERARSAEPRMQYDPHTRFVRGGELHLVMDRGDARTIHVEVPGDSGFFLKTVGYGDWKGHKHGRWMGPLHLDGEHIADCWDEEHLGLLGQFRDTPIRVREGDAVGYGIMESIVTGDWPELGLTADSDRDVRNA